MKKSSPKVSIISVNYNQAAATLEMLASVFENSYTNMEVIVVDNASDINPGDLFRRQFPTLKFIRNETNSGFAGGNNLGINSASGDYIFLLNNDAILANGTIETLIREFEKSADTGAVSPMIYNYNKVENQQPEIIQYAGATRVHPLTGRNRTLGAGQADTGKFTASKQTAYTHGAAMMIPRKVLEKVGLMDESFFLYYEELDWCERIRRAGFKIKIVPQAKVYHAESLSVGTQSPLKTYYLNRNRWYFINRNYSNIERGAFAFYFLFLAFPLHFMTYILKKDYANARALYNSVVWNLNLQKNRMNKSARSPAIKNSLDGHNKKLPAESLNWSAK